MQSHRKTAALLVFWILVLTNAIPVKAQVSTHLTYEDNIRNARSFAALDENSFGDKISLQDGAISFAYVDASVPTNSGLTVAIGRKLGSRNIRNTPDFPVFGPGWDLDVPYMMATYDSRDGWNAFNPNNQAAGRCTSAVFKPKERAGPYPYYHTQAVYAHMYWKGIQINIPGRGAEQLLKNNSAQVNPQDGKTYYGTTKSLWRISCLQSIKNEQGEGFLVKLPDGTVYEFDWMVKRKAYDLVAKDQTDAQGNGLEPWHLLAPLTDVYLYATKVTDRFGNTVSYNFDAADPRKLMSVVSNDGARLDAEYNANGRISKIRSSEREWNYEYVQTTVASVTTTRLSALVEPDGSRWGFSGEFERATYSAPEVLGFWSNGCSMDPKEMSASAPVDPGKLWNLYVKHPSGATAHYALRALYHGTNNAPGGCGLFGSTETSLWWGTWGIPAATGVMSIHTKQITGLGMSARTWSYSYEPSWSFQSQCNNGCASTSRTSVATTDGVVRRYAFGNDYYWNYGQLLSETVENAGLVYRTTTNTYLASNQGQPFPSSAGDIATASGLASLYGNPIQYRNLPPSKVITQQGGETFTRETTLYDNFVRPATVLKYNSLGYSRADTIEYEHNLTKWVIGQVKRVVVAGTDMNGQPAPGVALVEQETEYNTQALPYRVYRFGKLQNTLTYNADGTLATVADGANKTITLSNWKRGIPGQIKYPATPEAPTGATETAVIDDNGWIGSVTDEVGAKTCYGYDSMGRMSSETFPSETQTGVCDTSAWNERGSDFKPIVAGAWTPAGVSPGQWVHRIWHGNYRKITYYDAMWQPVLVHEYDASDTNGTMRATSATYDEKGRVAFQSYPSTSVTPPNVGTRTYYDPLGRVMQVEQDSEHGVLATSTAYLTGLRTQVTNPRGNVATTSFMAWDSPSYEMAILSLQPENKLIEILRHPRFGWPLQLKQRNAANTLAVARQYVYDGNAQLCKTIEPETGATVVGYDSANNPAWQASGLTGGTYASTTDCNYSQAWGSGRRVDRTYDARNRLTTLGFPDGRGDQSWTYQADGLPATVTAFNSALSQDNGTQVITAYSYNKRRLLTGESITQPNWYTWTTGYAYDRMGVVSHQTYPTGLVVDYAPNALGQATKAGAYASGAQYYPNGAIKQFTYGNGIVHTMQQNARQLPQRTTSSGGVLDYINYYDANGNVEHIANNLVPGYDARDRWMQYDALDRLTAAGSASFGGDHWHRFTYDALDNLKSWKLAGVKDYADYVYDATHRLTNIRNTAGATVVGMEYDPQGNLRNKNGQIHDFDYGNRLRSVAGKEAYRYDGLGRRVMNWRWPTPDKPDGSLSFSMYSQSGQVVYEEDYHSAPTTAKENIYLAGSVIATRESKWGVSTAVKYQHTDALGSPVAVTDASGQVIERMDYEPWGAIIGKPNHNGIGYTGHVMDGATGLTYMQQRYYDQSVGRFLSVDPVVANPSTGAGFNRYRYANNNPYLFVDPDGRYGRGSGWRDRDWRVFNDAQQGAARSLERAVSRINKALETGKGLKSVTRSFERTFGKGTGTAENMRQVASTMASMASALRDNGSGGFMANAMTASEMAREYPKSMSADVAAGVPPSNRNLMVVNINHPSFNVRDDLTWIVGHESAHGVGVEGHAMVNTSSAYKFGNSGEKAAFRGLPEIDPSGALRNPDTLMDFAR